MDRWLPDQKHAAGIAVVAILDDGDVNIDDVAMFQLAGARNTMTDLVIN